MSIQIVTHHIPSNLPVASDTVIPVQLYGTNNGQRPGLAFIGSQVKDRIRRLGKKLSPQAVDFLSFALAVTAADTFVLRREGDDNWTRQIALEIPLAEPEVWINLTSELEKMLHFLSGDIWSIQFTQGGYRPPQPYSRRKRYKLNYLYPSNCVCLFSGGVDSTVGVLDLLAKGLKPALVSHAYRGDTKHQNLIGSKLPKKVSHLSINLDPRHGKETEISMRTRSLNFLALAVVASDIVMQLNRLDSVDLFIPENGLISLNAPLTPRRIGSLSTRTTHPNFISQIQQLLSHLGLKVRIINPYQFLTKGEMLLNCQNQELLKSTINDTMSCSHWKRNNQQCGYCVPCLVRRAAIFHSNLEDDTNYRVPDLRTLSGNTCDDLFAIQNAISRIQGGKSITSWISKSGPLPYQYLKEFERVFLNGLQELKAFLIHEGLS